MKKNPTDWQIPAVGALLFAASATAAAPALAAPASPAGANLDSTNRITAMLRVELALRGGFKGVGSQFAHGVPMLTSRFTAHGSRYNYNDGYVLPDSTGSHDGYTWYWGYDNASQVNAANNTINFHNTSVAGSATDGSQADSVNVGAEIDYDRLLFKNADRNLYGGVELAVNWMPVSFGGTTQSELALIQTTDTYGYAPGTIPPGYNAPGALPYQGSFGGPGFSLIYPRLGTSTAVIGHVPLVSSENFDGNLWGLRLGPYLDYTPLKKLAIHVSGGFAGGLLSASASWHETLVPNGLGSAMQAGGSGSDLSLLAGFYVGADGEYKFNEHWSVLAGAQFQDLGDYSHEYGGRSVDLNFNQSVFCNFGISYSF